MEVRIALDSSVLIAAHIISRAGACAELLKDVLLRDDLVGALLRRVSIVVQPADLPSDLCRDPSNVPDPGTAVAGECALLIIIDRDLFDLHTILAIPIIRPGEYWRRASETD